VDALVSIGLRMFLLDSLSDDVHVTLRLGNGCS
jgi:hypothetical protein